MPAEADSSLKGRSYDGLCVAALSANGLAGLAYLSDALVTHRSLGTSIAFFAASVAIVLAVRQGGRFVFLLGAFALFGIVAILAIPPDWHWFMGHGPARAALIICFVLACLLQVALTLQLFERRRAEHNSWRRSICWGAGMCLVLLAAFMIVHRPDSSREWGNIARISLFQGVFWIHYIRFIAPVSIRTWAENKKEMLLVTHLLVGRPKQPPS